MFHLYARSNPKASTGSCLSRCASMSNCKYVSMNKAGTLCWGKSSLGRSRPNTDRINYVKPAALGKVGRVGSGKVGTVGKSRGIRPPTQISLKGGRSGKWCADEGNRIICNRGGIGAWEKFTIVDLGGNKAALKGGKSGKWCADEGNRIICNRGGIGAWEKFTYGVKNGKMTLKGGKDGKYCADDATGVRCNRTAVGGWEMFKVRG